MKNQPNRPESDDSDAWQAYWQAVNQPWRKHPEIGLGRQRYLAQFVQAETPGEESTFPFTGIRLRRADIEWLLTRHYAMRAKWEKSKENFPGTGLVWMHCSLCVFVQMLVVRV